jgi:phasin family protein
MINPIAENIAKANADAVAKSSRVTEAIVKGNPAALSESGAASKAGVQELTKAYHDLATKNVHNLTAAVTALSAVKSSTEFIELQQKLIKDGVDSAVADSRHIAQLTTSVFSDAFEPLKKQIEAVQKATIG